jgi:NADH-ubiquinone oxidoreductase chain 5
MVTFLINRLGDVFFLLSIALLAYTVNWDFFTLKEQRKLLSCIIIVAFITKRAQVPFSSWLPAAMAAPTPVSSLVHSSTLVTAGIFLLIRFNLTLNFSFFWLLRVSLITILMAGLMANLEWDIKKLIAYSTLSQLGFMVISLRVQLTFFTFFHLLCHALFKASLFMVSGVIIHNLDRRQDFRNSTRFLKSTPVLGVRVVVCLLCLCGFPFLSGFFSKDLILDGLSVNLFAFVIFLLAVALTFSYSLRFAQYTIKNVGKVRNRVILFYDSVLYVVFPVWVLTLTAILLGVF